MPLPTTDFRNPVCLEMKTLKNDFAYQMFLETDATTTTNFRNNFIQNNNNNNNYNNNKDNMGSVDSSDTFASCNTHPFNSQGDLTSDIVDTSCAIDSNLYVNPLDKSVDNSPETPAPSSTGRVTGVKKSASGDTALRSLGTSPLDENFREFGTIDRGSRVSLNDSPLPKQRRTRFQQVRAYNIILLKMK